MDVLAGRLTVALELLPQLLGAVQLQSSTVLLLLRTVSQVLTVQDLTMLQVKAIGMAQARPLAGLHAAVSYPKALLCASAT